MEVSCIKNRSSMPPAKSLQSCPTLCDPIPGILQARTLPFPSPMQKSESEVTQSYPTLRDPMDCSPPGSSVHRIFQARVLEWGAIAFSELLMARGNKS